MSFYKYKKDGSRIHKTVTLDCSKDKILTEQSHKDEVLISNIVKRHGIDAIQKTAAMQTNQYLMDDIPTNDFTEAMQIVTKAEQAFLSLPSQLRKQFNNNAAEYLDYVQNPANTEQLVEMGLAQRRPQQEPVSVLVTNPISETPVEVPSTAEVKK